MMTGLETHQDWLKGRLGGRGAIAARWLSLAAAPTFAVMALTAALAPAYQALLRRAARAGVWCVRVHDVTATVDAIDVATALGELR